MLATVGLAAFGAALVVPLVFMLVSSARFVERQNRESARNHDDRVEANFRGLPASATVHRFAAESRPGLLAA